MIKKWIVRPIKKFGLVNNLLKADGNDKCKCNTIVIVKNYIMNMELH